VFLWLRRHYVVPILTYHHVGSPKDKQENLNIVSVSSFEKQMAFLKRAGFRIISFDELVEGLKKGRDFYRRSVVIHFDDGYDNNYTNAYPILKKNQFPAMVFLIANRVGKPGYLTWSQVKEMDQQGVMAGSHTSNHSYLPQTDLESARKEIFGSKLDIEKQLGRSVPYFAYPVGGYTKSMVQLVKEAGYQAAVTTNRGADRFNRDLFTMNRIRMKESDYKYLGIILLAKCSGYYNLMRSLNAPKE
jgi:peptidoglycan/xylan/chitin deacetylase (PgdA/CDA1 family)